MKHRPRGYLGCWSRTWYLLLKIRSLAAACSGYGSIKPSPEWNPLNLSHMTASLSTRPSSRCRSRCEWITWIYPAAFLGKPRKFLKRNDLTMAEASNLLLVNYWLFRLRCRAAQRCNCKLGPREPSQQQSLSRRHVCLRARSYFERLERRK